MDAEMLRFLLLMPGVLVPAGMAAGLLTSVFSKFITSSPKREMPAAECQRLAAASLLAAGLCLLALVMNSVRDGIR